MTLRQRIARLPIILLVSSVLGIGLATLDPRSSYLGDYGAFLASGWAVNHGFNPYGGYMLSFWMSTSGMGAAQSEPQPAYRTAIIRRSRLAAAASVVLALEVD